MNFNNLNLRKVLMFAFPLLGIFCGYLFSFLMEFPKNGQIASTLVFASFGLLVSGLIFRSFKL